MSVSNFLSNSVIDSYSVYDLMITPYNEGIENVRKISSDELGIAEKVSHFVIGLLLMVPILNTAVYLLLSLCSAEPDLAMAIDSDMQELHLLEEPITVLPEKVVQPLIPEKKVEPVLAIAEVDRSEEAKEKERIFVKEFVIDFLRPYITGKITPKDEPNGHIPMRLQLRDALIEKGYEALSEREVRAIATSQYIKSACIGFYSQGQKAYPKDALNPVEIDLLCKALQLGFKNDFDAFSTPISPEFVAEIYKGQYVEQIGLTNMTSEVGKRFLKGNHLLAAKAIVGTEDDRIAREKLAAGNLSEPKIIQRVATPSEIEALAELRETLILVKNNPKLHIQMQAEIDHMEKLFSF